MFLNLANLELVFASCIKANADSCILAPPEEQIRIKSFSSDTEVEILQDFANLLNSHYNNDQFMLCAHNGKEFDIPFLARSSRLGVL